MKIWVDADLAPSDCRDIVGRAGERLGIEVRFVTSRDLPASADRPQMSILHSSRGDERVTAHAYMMANVQEGDVVVTRGVALGAQFVQRGVVAIDVRGEEYTASSIAEEPGMRELIANIRSFSAGSRGPPPYDQRAKREFAATVDRVLTRLR